MPCSPCTIAADFLTCSCKSLKNKKKYKKKCESAASKCVPEWKYLCHPSGKVEITNGCVDTLHDSRRAQDKENSLSASLSGEFRTPSGCFCAPSSYLPCHGPNPRRSGLWGNNTHLHSVYRLGQNHLFHYYHLLFISKWLGGTATLVVLKWSSNMASRQRLFQFEYLQPAKLLYMQGKENLMYNSVCIFHVCKYIHTYKYVFQG